MKINNAKLNLVIDIILLINMMIIMGVGFLIKYILLPGFKRNEVYGNNVELYYLGLDRHQWGTIHLILGFILLFLLVLHIVFHWQIIKNLYRSLIPNKIFRYILGYLLIIVSLLFGVAPLFVKPEIGKPVFHYQHSSNNSEYKIKNNIVNYHKNYLPDSISNKQNEHEQFENNKYEGRIEHRQKQQVEHKQHEQQHEHNKLNNVDINGQMTINEVSKKYNIPAHDLANQINVPNNLVDERLGRLKKQYQFDMDELREYIEKRIKK